MIACPASAAHREANVKEQYLVTTRLIERLHRRFLNVIKTELDRLNIQDVNNVQTLILFTFNEDQLRARPRMS